MQIKCRFASFVKHGIFEISSPKQSLFNQIVVNKRVSGGRLVNPVFVEIFGMLTVGNHKFDFHKRGDVVVDTHNHGVGAVCIFGIIAKI